MSVDKLVMVISGKGGVGKTLVAINLAMGLSDKGVRTALIDADISNPNCAELLGVQRDIEVNSQSFKPIGVKGVEFFSMVGISGERPVSMSGAEYAQVLRDVLNHTPWEASTAVLDMPATIADTFIELITTFGEKLAGSVVVVQPAHEATCRKVLQLHKSEGVPVLGVVENMSHFSCGKCGEVYKVFGDLDLEGLCKDYGVEALGVIPLSMEVRRGVQEGKPYLPEALQKPISRAVEVVMAAEPLGVGFVERLKQRFKDIARDVLLDVLASAVEIANTQVKIPEIQSGYGFQGKRVIEFDVTDESLRTVKVQEFFRVEDGVLKVVRNPSTVDDEIRVWDKALIWSFLGERPDTQMQWDLMDAWLMGKLKYYSTSSGTPRALLFMREVWGNLRSSPSFERLRPVLQRIA